MKYKDLVKKVEELEKIVKGEKPKGKITLQEFWASDKKLAIHCDTEDKAKKLLQAFDSFGMRWISGQRYTDTDEFYLYGNNTCYANNRCCCDIKYYIANNYTIYEFEDVILPEEPKWTFTEDEKIILRNVSEEYKWLVRNKDGSIYVFSINPIKENTLQVWSCGVWGLFQQFDCFNHLFQTIKWEDDDPCEFRKYI